MDGDDRLSALSDDLLRCILYLVPCKEAASTSVLSRRWRSLWRSSGAVNLAVRLKGNSMFLHHQSPSAKAAADEAFFSSQESFARAAAGALAAAESPVTRLTLLVDTSCDAAVIDHFLHRRRGWRTRTHGDVVGDVLSHDAAARHVEHLRVALVEYLDNCRVFSNKEIDRSAGIYSLLFLPSAATLRVLELTRCDLDDLAPPPPPGFPRLETLRLRLCSVRTNHLQALMDAAPDLGAVHLESVFFKIDGNEIVGLRFTAATTLVLALCGHGIGCWTIEIDAPRLRSLAYKGLPRRFLLRSAAPDLARVELHFLQDEQYKCRHYPGMPTYDKERLRVQFWEFMHNFTSARALKLKVDYDLEDIAANELMCAFPNVVRLKLQVVHQPATSKMAAVSIANLLHCCPVVRDLVLNLSTVPSQSDSFMRRSSKTTNAMEKDISGDGGDDDVLDIPGLSGRSFACMQSSLRRVSLQFRLDNSSSSSLGVGLVKFFANNAMVLEKMIVERWATSNSTKACFQHNNPVQGPWEFSRIPIAQQTEDGNPTVSIGQLQLQLPWSAVGQILRHQCQGS
ncbi:unnamed protein product [Urochloa decumbens]|uniref:F-box domain-containing protein n=1 Tax=Urochloa decumbens TaxID=240449 RepID=A0ABC9BYV3_9POAL